MVYYGCREMRQNRRFSRTDGPAIPLDFWRRRIAILDKLVFPFALPEEDRDLQLAQLLGDDCPGGEQGEENFYRSEDFLVK